MTIYETTKKEFLENMKNQTVFEQLEKAYTEKLKKPNYKLTNSWNGSFPYLYMVLEDERIPENCGISIEYVIPNIDKDKRIDFLITGYDNNKNRIIIPIETKQWSTVKHPANKIGFIETDFSSKKNNLSIHPSYQVWSYSHFLKEYNQAIQEEKISIHPCVLMHNYKKSENNLLEDNYKKYIEKAPIFYRNDLKKCSDFIANKICYGDDKKILHILEKGKITLSKILQNEVPDIMKYSNFATLIDEQQIVYETAMKMAKQSKKDNKKRTLIVKGGAGTGKTIVALKILIDLLKNPENNIKKIDFVSAVQTVSEVCKYKLKQSNIYKEYLKNFKTASQYFKCSNNEKDVVIVDEARRLREKSGFFSQDGENQIKEIILSSKFSIFFVDNLQKATLKDIGRTEEIKKHAKNSNSSITELELTSQFRCSGSSVYITWLENTLQLGTPKELHDKFDYDIKVVTTPQALQKQISKKNEKNNSSRIVAGYCWDSVKGNRNDPDFCDIQIPEYNFQMSWNLIGTKTWAIDENSIEQVGCVYTCSGLDFEYVGVIIGKDMIYKNGKIQTDVGHRARTDNALKGIKTQLKKDYLPSYQLADEVIKSTYRILMTRGQKGCIIFCQDKALSNYLKEEIKKYKM